MSEAKGRTVTCRLCGGTFNTIEERQRHNEQEHPKELARILEGLSHVLEEKGTITKADWENKIKEMATH